MRSAPLFSLLHDSLRGSTAQLRIVVADDITKTDHAAADGPRAEVRTWGLKVGFLRLLWMCDIRQVSSKYLGCHVEF